MSSVVGKLTDIVQGILSLPSTILNGIKEFFTGFLNSIINFLRDIWNGIIELPTLILDGIKDIFVPDTEEISVIFDEVEHSVRNIIGLNDFNFDSIWGNAQSPSDATGTVDFGLFSYSGKFSDFSYLALGVEYFRPYIRGFLALLLCIFHIRQALSLFNLTSGEINGASNSTEVAIR